MAFMRTSAYNINIVGCIISMLCLYNIQYFIDIKYRLYTFLCYRRCALYISSTYSIKATYNVCTYFNFINIFISLRLSRTHAQHTVYNNTHVCAMGGCFHKNRLPYTLPQRFRFPVPTTFHREDSVTDIRMMRLKDNGMGCDRN